MRHTALDKIFSRFVKWRHRNNHTNNEPVRIRKPIFIIGCGRSGTTLLFQLLQQHPDLVPTTGYPDGEDHVGWIRHGKCIISGLGNIHQEPGVTGYHYCLYMDEHDVDDTVIRNMHRYYQYEVLQGKRGRRVLNKCPHLSNKLRYVRAIFPDAFFIHVVRDCLPTVYSWIKVMQEQKDMVLHWPGHDTIYPCFWILPVQTGTARKREEMFRHETSLYPGGGEEHLVDYWIETNRNIPKQLEDNPESLLTIRYEDLVADPLDTLNQIAEFCQLNSLFEALPESLTCGNITADKNKEHTENISNDKAEAWLSKAKETRRQFGYL